MFNIIYERWDYTAQNYIGKKTVARKFTKRQAMQHLESQGFNRWGRTDTKLHSVYSNGNGTVMAYIRRADKSQNEDVQHLTDEMSALGFSSDVISGYAEMLA